MEKKTLIKELCITVLLDGEEQSTIKNVIKDLNEGSASHFIDYKEFRNVELTMYFPFDAKVKRNEIGVLVLWKNRYNEGIESLAMSNESILTMSIEECIKRF